MASLCRISLYRISPGRSSLGRWLILLALACLAAGCGRGDRWHLAGKVQHGGQPVGEGHITFDPIMTGTGGGFAKIINGTYDTRLAGRGQPGGPHRVLIVCYKGLKDPNNPDSAVVLLFPPFKTEVDLPRQASTMDFDVPADWK